MISLLYTQIWLVVWNMFYVSIIYGNHHPNCYSLIFFRVTTNQQILSLLYTPYGSKHCLRRYLSLQIIVNYTPNTSFQKVLGSIGTIHYTSKCYPPWYHPGQGSSNAMVTRSILIGAKNGAGKSSVPLGGPIAINGDFSYQKCWQTWRSSGNKKWWCPIVGGYQQRAESWPARKMGDLSNQLGYVACQLLGFSMI